MLQAAEVQGTLEVGSYLRQWLDHMRGRVRAKTHEGYEGLIRLYALPHLEGILLIELRPLHLQGLYSSLLADPDRHLSGGTVLNLHLVLTQALGQAVRWGLLVSNPAAGAQPPRPRRPELNVVDSRLASRLVEAARGTPMELPVSMAIATGMRRGEILGLRWADIDEDLGVAHIRRSLQTTGGRLRFAGPLQRPPPSRLHLLLDSILMTLSDLDRGQTH